jgi:hypothetical protein
MTRLNMDVDGLLSTPLAYLYAAGLRHRSASTYVMSLAAFTPMACLFQLHHIIIIIARPLFKQNSSLFLYM